MPVMHVWRTVLLGLLPAMVVAPGCATPVERPASVTGSIQWEGLERSYRLHVPPARGAGPRPLLIALHGGGGTGEKMERLTRGGFNTLADREGFVVVYPDGVERHWNDGRSKVKYRSHREKIDDVGFISALIDHLVRTHDVDKRRVYVTGMSNGAMMSNRLACELTDKLAAIAPVAGTMPATLGPRCRPSRPIPVLMIANTHDPMMPWKGGEAHFRRLKFGQVWSVKQTLGFWVRRNGCRPLPHEGWLPDKDPDDGTRVRRYLYHGCKADAEVMLYAVINGGHTWPGGYQYLPPRVIGRTSRDVDANRLIWDFFRRHRR